MQTPDEIRRDLPPEMEKSENEALVGLGMRLQMQRPIPNPAFRGDLRRRLLGTSNDPGETLQPSARMIRVRVASYLASGLLLLTIAALGLTGAGPFAP